MTEKLLEDSSKPWETFGHKEQWNERAPFALHDSDKTGDSVPPNSAHMLKGQGLLRNYLRAREINIAKKAAGHTRSQASRKPTKSFWCALMLSIWWEYFRLWRRTNADLSHNKAK